MYVYGVKLNVQTNNIPVLLGSSFIGQEGLQFNLDKYLRYHFGEDVGYKIVDVKEDKEKGAVSLSFNMSATITTKNKETLDTLLKNKFPKAKVTMYTCEDVSNTTSIRTLYGVHKRKGRFLFCDKCNKRTDTHCSEYELNTGEYLYKHCMACSVERNMLREEAIPLYNTKEFEGIARLYLTAVLTLGYADLAPHAFSLDSLAYINNQQVVALTSTTIDLTNEYIRVVEANGTAYAVKQPYYGVLRTYIIQRTTSLLARLKYENEPILINPTTLKDLLPYKYYEKQLVPYSGQGVIYKTKGGIYFLLDKHEKVLKQLIFR